MPGVWMQSGSSSPASTSRSTSTTVTSPHVAIIVATAVAAAYVCIRSFEQLAATFVLGLMPFYALAVIGVWRLRRTQPGAERPYRAFGYPWTLVLYVAGVLVVLGVSKSVAISLILMTLTGFGMMNQMAASNPFLQTIAADDKRGRVMSLFVTAFMGAAPFGLSLIHISDPTRRS